MSDLAYLCEEIEKHTATLDKFFNEARSRGSIKDLEKMREILHIAMKMIKMRLEEE